MLRLAINRKESLNVIVAEVSSVYLLPASQRRCWLAYIIEGQKIARVLAEVIMLKVNFGGC